MLTGRLLFGRLVVKFEAHRSFDLSGERPGEAACFSCLLSEQFNHLQPAQNYTEEGERFESLIVLWADIFNGYIIHLPSSSAVIRGQREQKQRRRRRREQ